MPVPRSLLTRLDWSTFTAGGSHTNPPNTNECKFKDLPVLIVSQYCAEEAYLKT